MPLEQFDPVFKTNEFGTTLATEVHFLSSGWRGTPGGTSDLEAWVLAVLAKEATNLFEFGTCTGRTTYLWARNSPPEARVYTLTLTPDHVDSYRAGANDVQVAHRNARNESRFSRFLYTGTPEAAKVIQLYGDSKSFDETPYAGAMDLVFVDGSHAASYVESDTRKALRMLKPGGAVIWHDYRGPRLTRGVFDTLNALARELPLVHLQGTSLVAYRKSHVE